jgi:hypothetical protein
MSSPTTRAGLCEHPRFRHRQSGDVSDGVDVGEARREIGPLDRHSAVDCKPGALDDLAQPVDRNSDEQVVRNASAALEPRFVVLRVDFHDVLVRYVLDVTLLQGVEDALGNLFRDRNRSCHRSDRANLDRVAEGLTHDLQFGRKRGGEERERRDSNPRFTPGFACDGRAQRDDAAASLLLC